MQDIERYFKSISKADLHNHFHLGGSQERLKQMYPKANIQFLTSYDGLKGMIDFIYGSLNTIMLTGDDVFNFMINAIESSIDDNVTYLEASVDTNLARFFEDSIETVINKVKRIKTDYGHKIDFKPDIGVNKDLDIDKVYSYSEAFIDSGEFFGIDLYGKEAYQDLSRFVDLFKLAEQNNIKTKVHIGEFSDAKSIEKTITTLNPKEIQHGINAVHSERVMDIIIERNIRLNICPQSNICLGAVGNLKTHPIRVLFDKGINVSVNTDDLILFNATVSDEMINLVKNGIFSFDEMETIRKNALP